MLGGGARLLGVSVAAMLVAGLTSVVALALRTRDLFDRSKCVPAKLPPSRGIASPEPEAQTQARPRTMRGLSATP